MSARIALATCAALPELDDDERTVVPALAARGIEAVPAVWDDPAVDWSAFDLVVVRCTWDYVGRRPAFLDWARAAGRVVNAPEVLEWSTDKAYLEELRLAGITVVPTMFVPPGERFPLIEGEVVVKPSESAGSRDTERHSEETERDARLLATRLQNQGRTVIVQPYLRGVEERGETALMYLGGSFSHAIHKAPILHGAGIVRHNLFVEEEIAPREPTPQERAAGDAVMAFVTQRFGAPVYARVDLLPALGTHLVLEVELAEPSLFLGSSPGAAERLADAIAALC